MLPLIKHTTLFFAVICITIFTRLNAQEITSPLKGIDIGEYGSVNISTNLLRSDAQDLGEFLYNVNYFDDKKRRIVEMIKQNDTLTFRFVLDKKEIATKGKEIQKINSFKTKLINDYKKTVQIKLVSKEYNDQYYSELFK